MDLKIYLSKIKLVLFDMKVEVNNHINGEKQIHLYISVKCSSLVRKMDGDILRCENAGR